jgi:peptide deformylase
MNLPIILYGSSVLREKAFEIDEGDNFKELSANMTLTLKNAKGIGLAGPQVGVLKNIFVLDTTLLQDNGIEPVEKVVSIPK